MSNKPFRVGCMGVGQIFNEAHLAVYISLDSVELGASYDSYCASMLFVLQVNCFRRQKLINTPNPHDPAGRG